MLIFLLRNRADISLSIHMIFIKKRQDLGEQQASQRASYFRTFSILLSFLFHHTQLFSFPNYIISSKKDDFIQKNIFFDRKTTMFFLETYITWFVWSSSIDWCSFRFDQTISSWILSPFIHHFCVMEFCYASLFHHVSYFLFLIPSHKQKYMEFCCGLEKKSVDAGWSTEFHETVGRKNVDRI